jgi:hypothetical protein
MKHLVFSLLLCAMSCLTALAIEIPKEHIYIFERSTNSNYVSYDINLQDGKLCQKEPLNGYWVLDDETRLGELTFLERKMAFGIKVVSASENEARVHMTAYKDLIIRICKHKGKWVGIVKMNGHEMILQKMFAQMKPPFHVTCAYVDIYGTDIVTGEKRRERVTP